MIQGQIQGLLIGVQTLSRRARFSMNSGGGGGGEGEQDGLGYEVEGMKG